MPALSAAGNKRFANHRLSFSVQGHCSARFIHCCFVSQCRDSDGNSNTSLCLSTASPSIYALLLQGRHKPLYLLLLHYRVSYFLHSLQTTAMMTKACKLLPSPWPFGFHSKLMEMKRKDIGENRYREVNKSTVTDSELCFLCIPSFNNRATGKNTKMSKSD